MRLRRAVPVLLIISCLGSFGSAAAQDWAVDRLEDSPRHHEWVEVQDGERTIHSFVAYPERAENALTVVVIHENRGLTDWVRSFTDLLAEAGHLAIAPDLLSEFDEQHDRTSEFASSDAARDAIYQLDADRVIRDLQAVREYAANMPASSGNVVATGFCWGGSQSFRLATHASDLSAALVFYGSPPSADRIPDISAPVYGFYGENDQRINATIPKTEELMAEHGKTYEYEVYDGAGHAFMRQGDDPDGSAEAKQARDRAWDRLLEILADVE